MTTRQFDPGLNPTQAWERSAERNPPAASRQKLLQRHDQISAGDGDKANASHDKGGPFPLRDQSDH
jgi:hypothetical protein